MSLFCRLSGKHYWSIPHRTDDNRLVKVCYECGAERPVVEVYKEVLTDWFDPTTKPNGIAKPVITPEPPIEKREIKFKPFMIGQSILKRLALGK